MIYPNNFELKIGFNRVKSEIESHCLCEMGKRECELIHFSSDYDCVLFQLSCTNEFMSILQRNLDFPTDSYFDLRQTLLEANAEGTYIPSEKLLDLRKEIYTIGRIIRFFSAVTEEGVNPYPNLCELTKELRDFPEISSTIDSVLDKYGNIKDSASPLLAQLRSELSQSMASINKIMRRILSEGKQNGILDKDTSPSVRDGRLVIPVSPMHRRQISGIVHDESATGKTVFIEPAEIVSANNKIRECEYEIKKEEIRILTQVASEIRPEIPDLLSGLEILGKIDFCRAKALFAIDINASMPKLEKEPQIEIYHGVHPTLFLSLREQGKEVVPLNLNLTKENHILVISGPNAGGKSVCLKTVGAIVYLTQCGILPPVYSNSHLGIFDNVFIDIGDQQSIEDDLSTYSSHLTNMKTFMAKGNERTLVLIDEFGGGTEPQIGGAIAQSILSKINSKGVFGVITTHYQNLKQFAEDTDGIINGAMLYDRQVMRPLFQLSVGYPGSSFAIEIARKIGLPNEVIDMATEIVGSDYVNIDKYLLDISRDRRYWERKRNDIRLKEKKLDATIQSYKEKMSSIKGERIEILHKAKAEAKELLSQSNASIERAILEIRQSQADKEKTKEARRQLEEFKQRLRAQDQEEIERQAKQHKTENRRNEQLSPIQVNDTVTVDGSNSVGIVESISGKKAVVVLGQFKTVVDISRLKKSMRSATKPVKSASISSSTNDSIRERQLSFVSDIDLRGMRADEAIQAVTYFLDDAIQFNISQVRILHGTGTGALKVAIRQYLDTIPEVKRYHDEHIQLGGAGITVVEL